MIDADKLDRVLFLVSNLLDRIARVEQSRGRADAAEFDESKHPRGPDGRFGVGGPGKASRDRVTEVLAALPTRDPAENWLEAYHYEKYTNDPAEVTISDIPGLKTATWGNSPWTKYRQPSKAFKINRKNESLAYVPIEEIVFQQPSVNKAKLAALAETYDPQPDDIDPNPDTRTNDVPRVAAFPNGQYSSDEHHRLIAAYLRGDKVALVRLRTYAVKDDNSLKLVPTPKTIEAKQKKGPWASEKWGRADSVPKKAYNENILRDPHEDADSQFHESVRAMVLMK